MSKQGFLNYKLISEKILFEDVLNWLNVPFQKTEKELKGEDFIITISKNLFFNPNDENVKGSVINYVAYKKGVSIFEAAFLLKAEFLSNEEVKLKREIPNLVLQYHKFLEQKGITPEVAKEYEVGIVKQRSIMSGRIAFKIYSHTKEIIGYIGYKIDTNNWFFPKGFKRPLYNSHNFENKDYVIVTTDPFDALKIVSFGEKRVVSLLANSMTSEQEEELKKYKKITLLHKEPHNVINRLHTSSFIKAPVLFKPLQEISHDELGNIIKPL